MAYIPDFITLAPSVTKINKVLEVKVKSDFWKLWPYLDPLNFVGELAKDHHLQKLLWHIGLIGDVFNIHFEKCKIALKIVRNN